MDNLPIYALTLSLAHWPGKSLGTMGGGGGDDISTTWRPVLCHPKLPDM